MPEAPTDEPGAAAVTVGRATVGATAWPPADLVAAAVDALRNPGLVVIAGAPGTGAGGSGQSTASQLSASCKSGSDANHCGGTIIVAIG